MGASAVSVSCVYFANSIRFRGSIWSVRKLRVRFTETTGCPENETTSNTKQRLGAFVARRFPNGSLVQCSRYAVRTSDSCTWMNNSQFSMRRLRETMHIIDRDDVATLRKHDWRRRESERSSQTSMRDTSQLLSSC